MIGFWYVALLIFWGRLHLRHVHPLVWSCKFNLFLRHSTFDNLCGQMLVGWVDGLVRKRYHCMAPSLKLRLARPSQKHKVQEVFSQTQIVKYRPGRLFCKKISLDFEPKVSKRVSPVNLVLKNNGNSLGCCKFWQEDHNRTFKVKTKI